MPKLIYIYFVWGGQYFVYWIIALTILLVCVALLIWLKKKIVRPGFQEVLNECMDSVMSNDFTNELQNPQSSNQELVKEVDRLRRQLEALEGLMDRLDVKMAKMLNVSSKIATTRYNDSQRTERGAICEAFDSGQSISEIAQRYHKAKGEVELILNLRRHLN
jgi:nitrate/nitrite-specific signal transduction histidine kinase